MGAHPGGGWYEDGGIFVRLLGSRARRASSHKMAKIPQRISISPAPQWSAYLASGK